MSNNQKPEIRVSLKPTRVELLNSVVNAVKEHYVTQHDQLREECDQLEVELAQLQQACTDHATNIKNTSKP